MPHCFTVIVYSVPASSTPPNVLPLTENESPCLSPSPCLLAQCKSVPLCRCGNKRGHVYNVEVMVSTIHDLLISNQLLYTCGDS